MSTTTQIMITPIFDDQHDRYKCCCGCCHVKIGTLVLGIWSAIGLLFVPYQLVALAGNVEQTARQYEISEALLSILLYLAVVLCFLEGFAVIMLFVGWAKERSRFMMPYLIMMGVRVFSGFAAALFFAVVAVCSETTKKSFSAFIKGAHKVDKETAEMVAEGATIFCVVMAIACVLGALVEMWFFTVIRGCARFFDEKAAFNNNMVGIVTTKSPSEYCPDGFIPEYVDKIPEQDGYKYARMP